MRAETRASSPLCPDRSVDSTAEHMSLRSCRRCVVCTGRACMRVRRSRLRKNKRKEDEGEGGTTLAHALLASTPVRSMSL